MARRIRLRQSCYCTLECNSLSYPTSCFVVGYCGLLLWGAVCGEADAVIPKNITLGIDLCHLTIKGYQRLLLSLINVLVDDINMNTISHH